MRPAVEPVKKRVNNKTCCNGSFSFYVSCDCQRRFTQQCMVLHKNQKGADVHNNVRHAKLGQTTQEQTNHRVQQKAVIQRVGTLMIGTIGGNTFMIKEESSKSNFF